MTRRCGKTSGNALVIGAWLFCGACVAQKADPTPSGPPVIVSSAAPVAASTPPTCSLPQGHYARYRRALSATPGVDKLESVEKVYLGVFDIVSRHYGERRRDRLAACCV